MPGFSHEVGHLNVVSALCGMMRENLLNKVSDRFVEDEESYRCEYAPKEHRDRRRSYHRKNEAEHQRRKNRQERCLPPLQRYHCERHHVERNQKQKNHAANIINNVQRTKDFP